MKTYTRKSIIDLHAALKVLQTGSFYLPTALELARCEKLISPELLVMQVASAQMNKIEGLSDYDEKYKALCEKDALRNSDGTFQLEGNSYTYPNAEIARVAGESVLALQGEYAEALAKRKEYTDQLDVLLAEVVEYELPQIKISEEEVKNLRKFFTPQQVAPLVDILQF